MPYRYLPGTRCADCAGTGKVLRNLIAAGFSADAVGRWVIADSPAGPIVAPMVPDDDGNYLGNEFRCLGCDGRGQQRVMED